MKRRHFLACTATAAVVGALPALASAAGRGPLLDDPESWLGAEFGLDDGSRIRLERVERLAGDRHRIQARLQFRTVAGAAPAEGLHRLGHGLRSEDLFLQRGAEGPVACVNRLRGLA